MSYYRLPASNPWTNKVLALLIFLGTLPVWSAAGQQTNLLPQTPPTPPPPAHDPVDLPNPALPLPPTPAGGAPLQTNFSVADIQAYKLARTPEALVKLLPTVALPLPASQSPTLGVSSQAGINLPATGILTTKGGVFPSTYLVDPTRPTVGGTPPAVSVTLQFPATRFNDLVGVGMRDGGKLSALGDGGKNVDADGGFFMQIAADGTVSFTYQAPATPGRYQVWARLDAVTTVLPFVVPDPSASN